MLDDILGRVQAFEQRHGITPNVVYLNHSHYAQLRQQCPGLFDSDVSCSLGFHLILVADRELTHPKIGWIPPRVRTVNSDLQENPVVRFHRRAG